MRTLSILLFVTFLCLSSTAHAAMHELEAIIDGTQEVPPSGAPGTGFATITYEDVTGVLSWDIQWSNLTGPATGMHFHGPATEGQNAAVQVNVGAISGLTSPSVGAVIIQPNQAADLLANLWYLNIHTAQFPGGEIRGQVVLMVSTPTKPSSWARVKALYR